MAASLSRSLAAAVAFAPLAAAGADGVSQMVTVPGTTAQVKVIVTITTVFTSTDDDTRTMATTGSATMSVSPFAPPFASASLQAFHCSLAPTTFVFQLFCLPFVGCQTLTVDISNLAFDLVAPVSSPVNAAGGVAFQGAVMAVSGEWVAGGLASASGTLSDSSAGTLSGRVSLSAGTLTLDQLATPSQTVVVDPSQLPAGVTALTVTVIPTLTATVMKGPLVALLPGDLNFNGAVNGADMGLLLGDWGGSQSDLTGDGVVDGADLGVVIGGWTG